MDTVWLENYNNQDVFVTDMRLGGGGIAYHIFDCEGNRITIEDDEDFSRHLKKKTEYYIQTWKLNENEKDSIHELCDIWRIVITKSTNRRSKQPYRKNRKNNYEYKLKFKRK